MESEDEFAYTYASFFIEEPDVIKKSTIAKDSDSETISNNINVDVNSCSEIEKTIHKNNDSVTILSEREKLDESDTIKSYNTVRDRIKNKCNESHTSIVGDGLSNSKVYTSDTYDATHSITRNFNQINYSNDINADDDEGLLSEDGVNNYTTIHHKDNFRKSEHNRKSLIHSNDSDTRFSRNTRDKMMQKRKCEYDSNVDSCNDDENDEKHTTITMVKKTPKKSAKSKKPTKRTKNDTATINDDSEICDKIVKSSSAAPLRSMYDRIDNSIISVISLKDLKRKDRSLAEHCNILTIHSPKLMSKIKEENETFYKVLLSTTPVEMVRKAGQNCVQFGNMEYLEWCELVLLQLCNLKKPLVLENTWRSICAYVNENMWCLELKNTLEQYQPPLTTLMAILHRNRRVKKDLGFIVGDEAFKTQPLVNYEILSKYKLGTDIHDVCIHSKTKFNFKSASVKYNI